MRLETFFEKFELFADTPNAVAKMRELILTLAMHGSLVPQDPNEESADRLLVNLRSATDKATGRRPSQLPAISPEEVPFDLPPGWVWERLGNIGETNIGLTYSPQDVSDTGTPVLRSSNIQNGKLDFQDLVRVKCEPKCSAMVQQGDLLICARNGSRALVGKAAMIENLTEPSAFGAFMAIFRSPINRFLYNFVCSPLFRRMIDEVNTTTINQITQNNLRSTIAPLPPLAEQKRIVAKVDELMALCDRLEAQQKEREEKHTALARASLARFTEAPTPANLDFLFHKSYDISPADLRKTILTLAVQGKLVPQDPRDENARAMIDRAIERGRQTIKSKSLRRTVLDDSRDLFERASLPSSWCIELLANLVDPENTISYGVLVPGNDVPDGVPFVRAQDLCLSNHPAMPNKTIAPEIENAYARTRLSGGEILLCVVGSIGKLGVVPDAWAGANIARAVARIKPISDVLRDYLLLVLQDQSVQNYFNSTTRTLAQPTLNIGMIEQTPIPVPPLAEQRRIVAKVDQLMALVDKLESQLTASRTAATRLMDAVVAELTAGAKDDSSSMSHQKSGREEPAHAC
jgi:type I restriction enzyme S subunit